MFGKKNQFSEKFSVVIVAGGTSSRMQGVDKQAVFLGDFPVIVRTVRCFSNIPNIQEIVIVSREDFIPQLLEWVEEFNLDKVTSIVRGGDNRQNSVLNGISALSQDCDYFVIHDGARPFADEELILRCMNDAVRYGAATASVPAKDTIKISDENGFVVSTPDRAFLRITQTPQIFRKDWYLSAIQKANDDNLNFTDDCQLVENIGEKVYLSLGSYFNIKITTPEDLPIAQAIADFIDGEE